MENKLGYQFEKHIYPTEDGYINTVFRIPGKKDELNGEIAGQINKPVAIYQHGLLDCCASIISGEEKSLGLKLVN